MPCRHVWRNSKSERDNSHKDALSSTNRECYGHPGPRSALAVTWAPEAVDRSGPDSQTPLCLDTQGHQQDIETRARQHEIHIHMFESMTIEDWNYVMLDSGC